MPSLEFAPTLFINILADRGKFPAVICLKSEIRVRFLARINPPRSLLPWPRTLTHDLLDLRSYLLKHVFWNKNILKHVFHLLKTLKSGLKTRSVSNSKLWKALNCRPSVCFHSKFRNQSPWLWFFACVRVITVDQRNWKWVSNPHLLPSANLSPITS